jgi:hypothetical protein
MNKTKINIIIDIFSGISFLISSISGLILKFFLYRGSGRLSLTFLNLTRDSWMDIHEISSLIFIGLIFLHLIFHWSFILKIPQLLKFKSKNK